MDTYESSIGIFHENKQWYLVGECPDEQYVYSGRAAVSTALVTKKKINILTIFNFRVENNPNWKGILCSKSLNQLIFFKNILLFGDISILNPYTTAVQKKNERAGLTIRKKKTLQLWTFCLCAWLRVVLVLVNSRGWNFYLRIFNKFPGTEIPAGNHLEFGFYELNATVFT